MHQLYLHTETTFAVREYHHIGEVGVSYRELCKKKQDTIKLTKLAT